MTDVLTKKPLRILQAAKSWPYMILPGEQTAVVLKLLQDHGIRCWQTGGIMSIDGGPGMGWITLGANENVADAQAILDAVP